jgi:hypothetical protein
VRLDYVEDSEFRPSENFSIQIKNHKAYFTVGNEKYTFGSKIYPIGKRGASIFVPWGNLDEEIKYREVAEAIENGNWKPSTGYCYTNAEILQGAFLKMGIDAKYYSGWAFPTIGFPIHHSWVVVDDMVYDIAVNISSQKKMEEQFKLGLDPYNEKCIREVKEIEKNWKPIVENFAWGNKNQYMIYVGAESDPNSARVQYDKCVPNDPSLHPSYRHMKKRGKYDMSPYQQATKSLR